MNKVTAQPKKTSPPSNMTESQWKWHNTPPKTWLRLEPDGDFVTKEWTSADGFRVTNVWNSIEGYRIVVRHEDPECLRAFNNLLDAALDVPAIEGPLPGLTRRLRPRRDQALGGDEGLDGRPARRVPAA